MIADERRQRQPDRPAQDDRRTSTDQSDTPRGDCDHQTDRIPSSEPACRAAIKVRVFTEIIELYLRTIPFVIRRSARLSQVKAPEIFFRVGKR
jgi:hypothetical protein